MARKLIVTGLGILGLAYDAFWKRDPVIRDLAGLDRVFGD